MIPRRENKSCRTEKREVIRRSHLLLLRTPSSDEQTPVQEQEQDFGDFWPEWTRILVFSSSRIIFGSLVSTFTILICVGAGNTSISIPKQDFFGSFTERLRSRSGSKNFGAGADPKISEQNRYGSENSGIRSSLRRSNSLPVIKKVEVLIPI